MFDPIIFYLQKTLFVLLDINYRIVQARFLRRESDEVAFNRGVDIGDAAALVLAQNILAGISCLTFSSFILNNTLDIFLQA